MDVVMGMAVPMLMVVGVVMRMVVRVVVGMKMGVAAAASVTHGQVPRWR